MITTLKILSENQAEEGFESEHGFSWLVEADKKVLFDTGASNLFLRNAELMQVDLANVDVVALSHGHWDHGNGLRYLSCKRVVCHPGVFIKRFSRDGNRSVGLSFAEEEVAELLFDKTDTPMWLSERIVFLGEIKRKHPFENTPTFFTLSSGEPDLLPDDSALAVVHNDGIIVITGCAHSGVCNIVDQAIAVTGLKKVIAVLGGFHLKVHNAQSQKTLAYLKQLNVELVIQSHCTSFEVLAEYYKEWNTEPVKAGKTITFS